MPSTPKGVIRDLQKEVGRDFKQSNRELNTNLKAITPVLYGTAQRGWLNRYRDQLFKSKHFDIQENRVSYIGVLDDGWSKKAPTGIVIPALQRTRRFN